MARSLSPEARERALVAAGAVLAADGIDGFTVDAVARDSGVAKTTIYRHFGSREELLLHTLDSIVIPFDTPDTGSLHGDLSAFVDAALPLISSPVMRRLMTGIVAAAQTDPRIADIHRQLTGQRKQPLRHALERARDRGEITSGIDVDAAMDFCEGPFIVRFVFRQQEPTEEAVRHLVDLVVRGLTG